MSPVTVLIGHPRAGSRTHLVAERLGADLAALRPGGDAPGVIDLAALGHLVLVPGDPTVARALDAVCTAELVVVAGPTFKGSYTGLLKAFLDLLPRTGLAGRTVVPVVTAASEVAATRSLGRLAELLTDLSAHVVPGLAVPEAALADIPGTVRRYVRRHGAAAA